MEPRQHQSLRSSSSPALFVPATRRLSLGDPDPDNVPHRRILSPDKTEWRLITATLSMKTPFCGWPVMVHDMHMRRRRLGDWAFLVAAARAWNSLPPTVTAASTLHSFHRVLKIHLLHLSHHLSYSICILTVLGDLAVWLCVPLICSFLHYIPTQTGCHTTQSTWSGTSK